jgi:FtsH-binding integral membrane protein
LIRGARVAYAALAWAFVAAIVLQVLFIGLGLFVGSENLALHRNFGWILHLAPLPILVAAALARAGRTRIVQAALLAVVIFFVPILAAVRSDLPYAAAFHPVGALFAFWLATVLARDATGIVGSNDTEDVTSRAEWVLVALIVVWVLFVSLTGSPET